MTKLDQEICPHELQSRNIIKYAKVDGCSAKTGVENGLIVFYHNIIFSSIVVEIETDQILFVGDTITTDDGELKIRERIYYPKDNHFDFLCETVYTGRRE